MSFDLIVIGAGPAGLAAAAYVLRDHWSIVVIAPDLSGKAGYEVHLPWINTQDGFSTEPRTVHWQHRMITTQHATVVTDAVIEVTTCANGYRVRTASGAVYNGHAVLVANGVTPQALGVPGEQRLQGYGVSYSAISHAPLFIGRRAVVVGTTPRALAAVSSLRRLAANATLVASERAILEDTVLGQQLLRDSGIRVYSPATVIEIAGDPYVTNITIADGVGKQTQLATDGVFIELGLTAHTDFLGDLVERTATGQIVVDGQGATRTPGLFAAGDITSIGYAEQMLIAMGDGARAGLSACAYLVQRS